jgi:hypothetical protein
MHQDVQNWLFYAPITKLELYQSAMKQARITSFHILTYTFLKDYFTIPFDATGFLHFKKRR